MARARFRVQQRRIPLSPVQRTRTEPILDPPTTPVLPTLPLPSGYDQALTAARSYNRSYERLSRRMLRSYGPIPQEIPAEYLYLLAPHGTTTEQDTEPLPEDLPTTPSPSETITTPATERSGSKHIITAICLIAVIIGAGSWLGSMLVPSISPKPTASQSIVRVNQLDPAQYRSPSEYDAWADSTCSAAAMTAVIDAYGHTYRVTDILKVEYAKHQITPELGLLYGTSSIARTVSAFGFSAHALDDPSPDGILAAALAGTPVIVGFRDPINFPTGHILVVRGGDSQHMEMVDSSKLNFQTISRKTFEHFYDGFAVLVTPNDLQASSTPVTVPATGYSILGQPSISVGQINQVLSTYHSPAAGDGQALYDGGVKYGIDPAYALAFFMNESTFGTQGMAVTTLALGNERCLPDRPCVNTQGYPCQTGQSCYAQFYSWPDGFEHWYMLMKNEYVTGHINQVIGRKACPCTTIKEIIPVYAPNSDNNNEAHYIWIVEHAVDTWRSGKVVVA